MEYKTLQYQIVQTANPTGWKWTVKFADGRTRTGESYSKLEAMSAAERAIDRMLKKSTGTAPNL